MNLNDFWRQEYMNDSYLSHLSITELSYREKYLMENLTTLELNGKIGLRNINYHPAQTLMRKFTHVLQEFDVRNEKPEKMFLNGASIPKAMLGHKQRLETLNKLAATKKPHLIKFGKKEFLEGRSFKISTARSFSDPSLNAAQMDDEMKAVYFPHPTDVSVSTLDGTPIDVQHIEITYKIERDYYIFCTSSQFDVRLFGDFEADACLFIYDAEQFSKDLYRYVSRKIQLIDRGYKKVTYIDPIRPDGKKIPPIEFHKHIQYLYQNEYRHVFLPKKGSKTPNDLFITLAKCAAYTELFCF